MLSVAGECAIEYVVGAGSGVLFGMNSMVKFVYCEKLIDPGRGGGGVFF